MVWQPLGAKDRRNLGLFGTKHKNRALQRPRVVDAVGPLVNLKR